MTQPNAPFGENTIEGAFLDDVDLAFESDITETTVRANGNDEHEIGMCNLELERQQVGVKVMSGESHPIVQMQYKLTVPVELAVTDSDNVVVEGFESRWIFTDVNVTNVGPNSTTVITERIKRTYGDTSEPDYENIE